MNGMQVATPVKALRHVQICMFGPTVARKYKDLFHNTWQGTLAFTHTVWCTVIVVTQMSFKLVGGMFGLVMLLLALLMFRRAGWLLGDAREAGHGTSEKRRSRDQLFPRKGRILT